MNGSNSVLIIGESGVGKTHYGAQLLMKLQQKNSLLQMDGAAKNIEPFSDAMDRLNQGLTAEHTPATSYIESLWPIKDLNDCKYQLIWPDYGGEQVFNISTLRNIPKEWVLRVIESSSWLFMIRTSLYRLQDDVLSRPLNIENSTKKHNEKEIEISDQTRLIELIQILIFIRKSSGLNNKPRVCFLMSCWDELNTQETPPELLSNSLPMLDEFIKSYWEEPTVMGLSALGKTLDKSVYDEEYLESGPEKFGYIVNPDGSYNQDITTPIRLLIV
ncbi:TPA: hypothetical protein QHU55_002557 [Klebsiella aerogenes]|nr:hypothetical protein [Klebsiella aerogenes]